MKKHTLESIVNVIQNRKKKAIEAMDKSILQTSAYNYYCGFIDACNFVLDLLHK